MIHVQVAYCLAHIHLRILFEWQLFGRLLSVVTDRERPKAAARICTRIKRRLKSAKFS